MQENNIYVLFTVFLPLVGAVLSLALARHNTLQRLTGLFMVALSWFCSLLVLNANLESGIQLYRLGNWQPPYGIVLAVDLLGALFALMASTVVLCGVIYVVQCHDQSMKYPAFMPLLLIMTTGLLGAFYTGDIFTLFVFIELMVMSSVALVSISDNRLGLEAAMKYLLISAMGTLFLLIGIASVYATFGTLNLADIGRFLALGERPVLVQAAAVMLMCAFLLKSAVFPFHFWQPDFHTTAPTPLSALLSSVVVKVGIYGLIRLTTLLFADESDVIRQLLLVLGIIGIFFGSLSALRTYDAKRMLAYSTFGQIGFILVGIGWGTPLALVAAVIYTVNHAFIKSALLMLTGYVASWTKTKTARLSELGGVGQKMTAAKSLYFIGGLALAGVPPLNGFISKLAIVEGGISAASWVPLGLAVSAGILTLLYMMRTWQHIFQKAPDESSVSLKDYGDSVLAPAILITICVALGLFAEPLVELAERIVLQISNPAFYIQSVLGISL